MKKSILFVFIVFFLLPNIVSAFLTIKIDIENSFSIGDRVSFGYNISSDTNQTIMFIPGINCPNVPIPYLEQKTIYLKSQESYRSIYQGILIDESIEPQKCTAYIRILSPEVQLEEKNFTIITKLSFVFELKTCEDQGCAEKSKTFLQNKNIYLDYESEVENPLVLATLTLPNKTIQKIFLPTLIKAEQIGTYSLNVKAKKEGYSSNEKTIQFGVIEKEAEIKTIETFGREISISDYILIIAFIIVFLLAIVLFKFR